jgi:hypothetical protein
VSKRIDDGTKVSDTCPKHKHDLPSADIRFPFDEGHPRRNCRTPLVADVLAAQRADSWSIATLWERAQKVLTAR